MAITTTYSTDSDADDEFERSNFASPTVRSSDLSPTSSDGMTDPEHTPTTFSHSYSGGGSHTSPTSVITQWTADQSADFLRSLGLGHYAGFMLGE